MANTVRLKRSAVQGKAPVVGDLALGELAVNTYDGKLYTKKNDGSDAIVEIGAGGGSITVGSTAPSSPSTGDLWYDTETARTFVYTGTEWVDANPDSAYTAAATGDSAPSSPNNGDLWYRTSDGRMYVYYDDGNTSQWVDANPNLPPDIDAPFSRTGTTVSLVNAGDTLSIDGVYQQTAEAVAALDIDCSTGNYFTKAISADSTFTFSNVPSSGTAYSFTLELDITGDRTITWPTSVKFNGDSAPTLTADKTHLFSFITDDGGTRFRAAALVDYVD